jgi:hypothetical protein
VVSGFWPRSAKGRDVVSGFWRERERASARAREEIGRKIGSCGRRESMFWSFFPVSYSSSFLVF